MYSIIELREIPLKNYAVNIDRDAIIGGWYGTIKQIYRWQSLRKNNILKLAYMFALGIKKYSYDKKFSILHKKRR